MLAHHLLSLRHARLALQAHHIHTLRSLNHHYRAFKLRVAAAPPWPKEGSGAKAAAMETCDGSLEASGACDDGGLADDGPLLAFWSEFRRHEAKKLNPQCDYAPA